jgi:hypothetical protein
LHRTAAAVFFALGTAQTRVSSRNPRRFEGHQLRIAGANPNQIEMPGRDMLSLMCCL